MNNQVKEYDRFVGMMEKKEKLLIKGKTKQLQAMLKDEEKLINELEILEKKRIEAIKDCFPDSEKPPSLREVLDNVPDDLRKDFEQSAINLVEKLNKVAALNRSNAELIKESLNFIMYNVNLLSSDPSLDNIYENTGKLKGQEPPKRGILNHEA